MKTKITTAILAALTLTTLFGANPAYAADIQPTRQHCAVEAHPIASPEADVIEPVCFDSIDEVEAYVTSLPPMGRAAAASVVIGTIFENDQYGGASLTYFAGGGCHGVTYGYPSLPSGWYGKVSSAKGSSNCWISLYAGDSYSDGAVLCPPNCATLSGTFNDRVRSMVFRPTGTA